MSWNSIAGIASTCALFLPVLLILSYKLFRSGSFLALCVYYLTAGIYNLMVLGYLPVTTEVKRVYAVANNYMDAPLMLIFLVFFCTERWKKNVIINTLLIFIAYEMLIAAIYGFESRSSTYVLGPDILVVLLYSIYLFVHYGKITIIHGKSIGITLMLVGILFAYGCFTIIYVLYYIQKTPAIADVFLVYYMVTFISSVLVSMGLIWVHKRTRQIHEVQTTRKELALFFDT